ncbi:NAD(P)/FAD-dependent oxidoreductase [Longispora sp. K20-0274]|uniref:FAD-dependent oxidoreductase n=1 Tax=Longispora sp. K20-0274 TaxID=3088255 RepID=UPI00399ABDEE
MRVIVIGAGTGGLCLAHGLRRAGIDVTVHERDRTRTGGLQGYRVGISPSGSRALSRCLPPELYSTFLATCARAPRHFSMYTEKFREVLTMDLAERPAPEDNERSVSRMTLRQVLLTGLEDVTHFDRVFTGYDQHPDGTVTAHFADGTTVDGDVLVGADGSNSAVRRQYLPHARLEDAGIVAVGGKVALTPEIRALLPDRAFHGISTVFAPGGQFLILHVMEFPWGRDGTVKTGIGGTDAALIAAWPGLLFDNTRDYVMWGFSAAADKFPADFGDRRGAELLGQVRAMTGSWHPDLRRLFDATEPDTVFRVNIRTSVPVEPWAPSPVTLLGDAIHTMTPGRGIGANTALRDAALLTRELTAVRDGRLDLLTAIGGYETRMREYGYAAVAASKRQMSGADPIHRPVLGRAVLAGMRTGMRLVNRVPALKRRMAASEQSFRLGDDE